MNPAVSTGVWLCVVGLFACVPQTRQDQQTPQPNIILIMADDLGYETLGCYGGQSYQTPNLDKLASRGIRFDNCYATPLCTPSRVQLMTGKYNFRNYIGFGLLDPSATTFGHLMKEAGYQTGIVGKWQLYGNKVQRKLAGRGGTLPESAGFDSWCLWQVKDRGFRYKDPTLETNGSGLETFPGEYGPDRFVTYIEQYMEHNRDRPFFLYFPMCLTHDPFQPTPASHDFGEFDSNSRMNDTTYFADMVEYMDQLVGRIVKKTSDLNIDDHTLILFIGDNGTDRKVISTWRGKRIRGNKGFTTEAGTHVPFIAYWKGTIHPGQVNQDLVDFTDFLPSMLEVAGSSLPSDFVADGQSFYPALMGLDFKPRDWIYCHYDPNWGKFTPTTYAQDKQWKLYQDGTFYDIKDDPTENRPLGEDLNPEQLVARNKLENVLFSFDEMQ